MLMDQDRKNISMSATGDVKSVKSPSFPPFQKGSQINHIRLCSFGSTFEKVEAKHLVAGNPLEPSLPLPNGNMCEELG
jgi:hypothetical protein